MYLKLYLFVLIFCAGCSPKLSNVSGSYKSTCILHIYRNVILTLKKDNTFFYQFADLQEKINETWKLNGDTIFLYSKYFTEKYLQPLAPKYKNTDLIDKDAYLIHGKKLFVLTSMGKTKDCYLIKN
jgi:hypothetical protein